MNTPNMMDVENIKELIRENMKYPYLEKHIPEPIVDENKLLLFISLIKDTSLSKEKKLKYIITTMLVQIALDTHELVPEYNRQDETNKEKLEKQLHVLAGDYYSGLYYYLLAKIDEIEFIHTLAVAITEINEYKMKLYYKNIESLNEYIQTIINIESSLTFHIGQFFGNQLIQPISEELLSIKRLDKEKHRIIKGLPSTLTPWLSTDGSSFNELDHTIKNKVAYLEELVRKLPNQYRVLKEHIRLTISEHTSVMEEGY